MERITMDLRRLSHVVTLADTLHSPRAAEAAHLSQPAFSRSIQAIESDLGIRLFDRDVGDVRPTPAREFVIERARELLFRGTLPAARRGSLPRQPARRHGLRC